MKASFIFIITFSALLLGSCRPQSAIAQSKDNSNAAAQSKDSSAQAVVDRQGPLPQGMQAGKDSSAQAIVDRLVAREKALAATLEKLPYYAPVKGQPPIMVKAPAGYGARKIPLTKLRPEDYGKVFCPAGTRSVVIPKGVVRIPESMCFNFGSEARRRPTDSDVFIEQVSFPSTLRVVGEKAFINNKIKELSLPEGLELIGPDAFQNNELSSITFPRRHKLFLDNGVFAHNKLKSLVLPGNVKLVGFSIFAANELTQLTIEEGVTTITQWAFYDNKLEHVFLPQSLQVIDYGAFKVNEITSIIFPRRHELFLGEQAFLGNKLKRLVIPKNVRLDFSDTFAYNELTQLTVEEGVTSIAPYSFGWNKLEHITLPSTIEELGPGAFAEISPRDLPIDLTILARRAPKMLLDRPGIKPFPGSLFLPSFKTDDGNDKHVRVHVVPGAEGYNGLEWQSNPKRGLSVKVIHDAQG